MSWAARPNCYRPSGLAMLLVGLLVLTPLPARAELPSLQELIRQTDEAITAREKENNEGLAWPLGELAIAQAYAGDYPGAVRTARRIRGIWQTTTLLSCWEIHFNQTGKWENFPQSALSETKDLKGVAHIHGRVEMAKVLVKAGQTSEALKLLADNADNRESAYFLKDFYLFLAEYQVKHKEAGPAAASLRRAWQFWEQAAIRTTRVEWFAHLAQLFLGLGDRGQALVIQDAALKQMRERTQKEEAHVILSEDWAELGILNAELGDKEQADECFREALRLADAAQQKTKFSADLGLQFYVTNLGHIATRLLMAGRNAEARDVLHMALDQDEQIQASSTREFALFQLVESLPPEGKEQALDIVKQMRDAHWKCFSYSAFALKLADAGRQDDARSFLRKAEPLAGAKRDANSSTSLAEKLAEVKSKLGDQDGAKRSLSRALQISRSTKGNQFHQRIARCQVRLGLLKEAYETIEAMHNPEHELLPLAELTSAVAKKEALARFARHNP